MTLIGIPYFLGENSVKHSADVEALYSNKFLNGIFRKLKISDAAKKEEFTAHIKVTTTSYLTAKDLNAGRIQPNKQKDIIEKYASSLKTTQERYRAVMEHTSTSGDYHNALRDIVKNTQESGMKEMFSPYVTTDDEENRQGGISISLFDKFLGALIESAERAPAYTNRNNKANLDKDYILWWVDRMKKYWNEYTDIPFALGDWIKFTEEEAKEHSGKKGIYKSICVDVLFELLSAVDKEIQRSDIETALRKVK